LSGGAAGGMVTRSGCDGRRLDLKHPIRRDKGAGVKQHLLAAIILGAIHRTPLSTMALACALLVVAVLPVVGVNPVVRVRRVTPGAGGSVSHSTTKFGLVHQDLVLGTNERRYWPSPLTSTQVVPTDFSTGWDVTFSGSSAKSWGENSLWVERHFWLFASSRQFNISGMGSSLGSKEVRIFVPAILLLLLGMVWTASAIRERLRQKRPGFPVDQVASV
jgi:hypothetical protein